MLPEYATAEDYAWLRNPTRNARHWPEQRAAWAKAPRSNRRAVAAWGWKCLTKIQPSWPEYWKLINSTKGCIIN